MCTSPNYIIRFPATMWTTKKNGKIDPLSKCRLISSDAYQQLLRVRDPLLSNVEQVACGQCIECRIQKSHEWAVRLYCESLMYPSDDCWFITLTYDPSNLPEPIDTFSRVDYKRGFYSSLSKKTVSNFMKAIRNNFGDGIRFFACGEYMPMNLLHMPHYHICIFGLHLASSDLKLLYTKNGKLYYNSPSIDKCWYTMKDNVKVNNGFAVLSQFSSTNAQYTAQYCVKKFTGQKNKDYYELCAAANVKPLTEEFITMSRRPGIGLNYMLTYQNLLMKNKKIYMREGKISRLPRYFKDKLPFDDNELALYDIDCDIEATYRLLYLQKQTDLSYDDILSDRARFMEKLSYSKRKTF